MKKLTALLLAYAVTASGTCAFAKNYTYEYQKYMVDNIIPQAGLCETQKSYMGYEDEIDASSYFSGVISAFRADIDFDGDDEMMVVDNNTIKIYKMLDGAPSMVAHYPVILVTDYGESYANIFIKEYEGREYLCVENFVDDENKKSYCLEMLYLAGSEIEKECSVKKEISDNLFFENAFTSVNGRSTNYSNTIATNYTLCKNDDNYAGLYDAAWQMFNVKGFENPEFLDTVNRLRLEETDNSMYYQLTHHRQDIDLKTYTRATGIKTSQKPVVYFLDKSELKELNTTPTSTPEPIDLPVADSAEEYIETAPAPIVVSDEKVTVVLDGKKLDFKDQEAVIVNNRTLVPLRAIFEALGADVSWNEDDRIVSAISSNNRTSVSMKIDHTSYYVNHVLKILDVPPMILNDRTLIPARAVAEALHCSVDWDAQSRTVIIKSASPAIDKIPEYLPVEDTKDDTPEYWPVEDTKDDTPEYWPVEDTKDDIPEYRPEEDTKNDTPEYQPEEDTKTDTGNTSEQLPGNEADEAPEQLPDSESDKASTYADASGNDSDLTASDKG